MSAKVCIIGFPVRHSRSPIIHQFWLEKYGISGTYEKAEVPPERLLDFIHNLSGNGYIGANVTLPYKEAAFKLVDEVSETGRFLGAINTLWFENGRLIGDNTDVEGFLNNLDACSAVWDQEKNALILGAGGASRAVIYALLMRGFKNIWIANRTQARASALALHFQSFFSERNIIAIMWDDLTNFLPEVNLLINATSLGMKGQPPLEINVGLLPESALVADIIYAPLKTDLLLAAQQRGLQTVGGLGMLLHQAVPGFKRWFGIRPQVSSALYDLVAEDLQI